MKHFIKRVSALALACVLVIAMGCPAFSANKEDSIALDKSDVEMKEFLTTRGFTEDYLDALIPQQLEILYQTCYSNDAYFLSVTKIPVAVPYGNISTDQLELEATYTYTPYVINGVTYMYEIHVMVNYDWIKVPMIKKADAISVNWDNTILTYNDNVVPRKNQCQNQNDQRNAAVGTDADDGQQNGIEAGKVQRRKL